VLRTSDFKLPNMSDKLRNTSHESQATSSVFYICREYSTNRPFFMQNKANVKIGNMNITLAITMNYINEL